MARLDGAFLVCLCRAIVAVCASNGVLTGLDFWSYPFLHNEPDAIADHIVWYNNEENSGWRLFTMPVDDLLYGMLLIGINVSLFEAFSARGNASIQINA